MLGQRGGETLYRTTPEPDFQQFALDFDRSPWGFSVSSGSCLRFFKAIIFYHHL